MHLSIPTRNVLLCAVVVVAVSLWLQSMSSVATEDAPPLQKAVLVLPLQAGEGVPDDQAVLGLAVQNVLENMLAVHSELEENWANWALATLFPTEEALHAWIQGKGAVPSTIPALGLRYLLTLTGQVSRRGDEVQVTLTLQDRSTKQTTTQTVSLDFPALATFRQSVIEFLARAGVPVPAAQQPKMLWPEQLPLPQFVLLGRGLMDRWNAETYHTAAPVFHPELLQDALKVAPQSYLLRNNLGWVYYQQQKYAEAKATFVQAVEKNPAGADALDGMMQCAIAQGEVTEEEQWARQKAASQGQESDGGTAKFLTALGNRAAEQKQYAQAFSAYRKAQTVVEQALPRVSDPAKQRALQVTLADVHMAWAMKQGQQQAYTEAIVHFEAAYAIDKRLRRAIAGLELIAMGQAYTELGQPAKAITSYEQALVIKREIQDRAGEEMVLSNLGMAYTALRQPDRAIPYFEQALVIKRELRDRAGEGFILTALGSAYQALSQYDKAVASYEQALVIKRELQDRAGEGEVLSRLGIAYVALLQPDEAIAALEQALAVQRELQDRAGEGNSLKWLGNIYAFNQPDKAVPVYEQALVIVRAIHNQAEEGVILEHLGQVYQRLNQVDKAIPVYEQAVRIRRKLGTKAEEGATLQNLAHCYRVQGQVEQAIAAYEQALAITREVHDRNGEGTTLNNLGEAYSTLSQFTKAIDYFEQALSIMREIHYQSGERSILKNLGFAYTALSQHAKAVGAYERALVIDRVVSDRVGEGSTLNNLASAYLGLSQYATAISYLEQALVANREVYDQSEEARTLTLLGVTYGYLSQYEKALNVLEQALPIARLQKQRVLSNLGAIYAELGQYEKTLAYYEQALASARARGDRLNENTILNNIATVYSELKQHTKAISYVEQALTLARKVHNRHGEAIALVNLEFFLFRESDERGQQAKGLSLLAQPLAIAKELGDQSLEGKIYTRIAHRLILLDQFDTAQKYLHLALEIARELGDRDMEEVTLGHLSVLWGIQKQHQLGIFYSKQWVNLMQVIRGEIKDLDQELRRSFLKSKESTYRSLANRLLQEGRAAEAEQVMRMLKEEEFFEFLRRDRQSAPLLLSTVAYTPSEAPLVAQYARLGESLTRLGQEQQTLKHQPERTEAESQRLAIVEAELVSARQAFDTYLQGLPAAFATARSTEEAAVAIGTNDVQTLVRQTEPGTVLLWTVLGEKQSWVVLVSTTGRTAYKLETPSTTLIQRIAQFRTVLRSPQANPLPLAQELYTLLFSPIAAELDRLHARTLLWSLDGPLRYVPLAALHDGQHYLVERYALGLFSLAGQQTLETVTPAVWRAAGFGVSEASRVATVSFAPLPAVPEELQAIIVEGKTPNAAGKLPGIIRLNTRFTSPELQQALKASYPVVHIASHFQLRPGDASASFLLLGGGQQLPVAELTGYHFGGVELLALSACETGVGSDVPEQVKESAEQRGGKEVESFAMLVQYRGAKTVLASLWAVADASTKEVMARFYQGYGQQEKRSSSSKRVWRAGKAI